MNKIAIFCILLLTIIFACQSTYKAVEEQPAIYRFNLSSIYNPRESPINPQSFVYHDSDNSSSVFFNINVFELKPIKQTQEYDEFQLGIRYVLRDKEDFSLVDSANLKYNIKRLPQNPFFYSYFNISTEELKEYILTVLFYCGKSGAYKRMIFNIDKTSELSADNYFVELTGNYNQPVFNNFVYADNTYRIYSSRINNDSIKVKYYEFDDKFPSNPYAQSNPKPSFEIEDSSFMYLLGDTISFINKGIYFFKAKSEISKGLLLLNSGDYFPAVKTVDQMVPPMYYVMSARDYNRLTNSVQQKIDIDEFWYSLSGNEKIAKEQIRVYYNRVRLANIFFSDYRQGYRTDRGMVYIMMGAPSVVRRNENTEEWLYGRNREVSGFRFEFIKMEHPLSGYIYEMNRGPQYQNTWGQAISTWRGGRVFIINK